MKLEVIRGGESDTVLTSKKVFFKAYATNTRLMGVTVVHAIFHLPENFKYKYCHLFFYFDYEEYNFDSYDRVLSETLDDPRSLPYIESISEKMFGGLGGKLVEITEKEFRALISFYYERTIEKKDNLPDGIEEYSFLLDEKVTLNRDELYELYNKITEDIVCNNQVVTYFLMRLIGRDLSLSNYLTNGKVKVDYLPYKKASLLRNKITELSTNMEVQENDSYFNSFNTTISYFVESLIESKGRYYIQTSEISVTNHKISSFKILKTFEITFIEANFMTKKEEYISLYEFSFPIELIPSFKTKLSKYSMSNYHPNGIVRMVFNENNDHTKNDVFNLSDDVKGVQYITKYNQIVLLAYSKENLKKMERDLKTSNMKNDIEKVQSFTFSIPIFYNFVNADYEDFLDFVDDQF